MGEATSQAAPSRAAPAAHAVTTGVEFLGRPGLDACGMVDGDRCCGEVEVCLSEALVALRVESTRLSGLFIGAKGEGQRVMLAPSVRLENPTSLAQRVPSEIAESAGFFGTKVRGPA